MRQKTDQPRPIEPFSAEVERLGRARVIFEGQLFRLEMAKVRKDVLVVAHSWGKSNRPFTDSMVSGPIGNFSNGPRASIRRIICTTSCLAIPWAEMKLTLNGQRRLLRQFCWPEVTRKVQLTN